MSIPVPQAQNNLGWLCANPLKPGSIHLHGVLPIEPINPNEMRFSARGHERQS